MKALPPQIQHPAVRQRYHPPELRAVRGLHGTCTCFQLQTERTQNRSLLAGHLLADDPKGTKEILQGSVLGTRYEQNPLAIQFSQVSRLLFQKQML